jgi:opacity protein-like surface antigen
VFRKGLAVLVMTLVLGSSQAWAQHRAEITAFGGWQFGGRATVRQGELKLKDAGFWGVAADVNVRPGGAIELWYSRQETTLKLDENFGFSRDLTDMTVEYFQAGGLLEVQRGTPAVPFVSFTLGATHYNPKERSIDGRTIDDEWRFSFILGLGVKTFFSERVGARLQGHFYSTFMDTGGSLWCGGGGCSFGLFGYGIYQGDISAGLSVAF